MVEFRVEGDRLMMEVLGSHKFWALRGRLEAPLSAIRAVTLDPEKARRPRGFKAPGSAVPGFFYAGTFYTRNGKEFWDVRRPEHAVIVELEGESFARWIVEVADPQGTSATIRAAAKLSA